MSFAKVWSASRCSWASVASAAARARNFHPMPAMADARRSVHVSSTGSVSSISS